MKRNTSIDILKAFCIVCILITHFDWSIDERRRLLFPFWINMAVPIFMYISGYVNAQSYLNKGIYSLSEMYSVKNLYNKAIRFVVPFTMMYIIQVFIKLFLLHQNLSFFWISKNVFVWSRRTWQLLFSLYASIYIYVPYYF